MSEAEFKTGWPWFWGYLHSNGTVQVKHWWGDHQDYREDTWNNPFILAVVPPFQAETRQEASNVITQALTSYKFQKA